jgi:protein TonB
MLNPELLKPKLLEGPIYLPMIVKPTPPEPVVIQSSRATGPRRVFVGPPRLTVPTRIPEHAAEIADAPSLSITGSFTGSNVAVIPGLGEGLPPNVQPIPEPKKPAQPKPAPQITGPVQVSTGVQAAKLIFGPKPPYPPLAKAARVQGTVKIAAIIATNGAIKDLHVIGGPPLLVKAALDAVQQWRYQPTLLSGMAVEVITEIDVNFTLNQ